MKKKMLPKILNAAAPATNQTNNKFWNFINNGGDSAELQLFGTISSEEDWWSDDCVTYRNFINELNGLGNKKNINVLIQSSGGDVFAANAIYNALVANSATITATVIGLCASAATIILQAASTRRIAKNGVVMAHNPSVTLRGSYQSEDLIKLAEVTDKVKESIMSVYRDRLGKTDKEIEDLMNAESWFVGQEAVDNGFCDEVVEENFQNSILNEKILTVNGIGYSFTNYVETFVPDEVRKKVQNLSKTPQKDAGTFSNNKPQKGNEGMGSTQNTAAPVIENAAQLRSAYPDLIDQIVDEAIKAERDRLKDIDSIANGIPNDILLKAKYEEPISAADLALAQLRANNQAGQQMLNNLTDDLANSGAGKVGAVPNVGNDGGQQTTQEQKEAKINGFANALGKDKRRGAK
jgi:ATP-dependent protease ClpP protease subunit